MTVELKDGSRLEGFARGRTSFDIQLQDLKGRFHLLDMTQISAIRDEEAVCDAGNRGE